ncbi:hypothetical protein HYPSUDRAFT_790323 [Hypholoma sublateritium FD-334 SS-4]|uniref:Uncharacterized protein n=1 Tax=Hypholoma sublateritium (strain FD-334 SS-4) TaxID=945553 RepID=A0A0D2Q891_HYPSF|nr:hypothetical protein HYPSUDRAFT_790323 [Hypholoma sublateritium FD-334 SS-4]
MLQQGERGDARVEEQISDSNSRTKQMLKMFQSKSLSLTLVLYPPALISKQKGKPVDSLAIPCKINQEMTLDSLLCRMPLTIAKDWIFSLGLNPFCYPEEPTIQKAINSSRKIWRAFEAFRTLKETKDLMPTEKIHIVMDRGFLIHVGWLLEPPRIFGNAWPLQIIKSIPLPGGRSTIQYEHSTTAAMKSKFSTTMHY